MDLAESNRLLTTRKLCNTIKRMNGKKTKLENELIKFNGTKVKDPKKIDNSFNKEFGRLCHVEKSKLKQQKKRKAKKVGCEGFINSTKMIDEAQTEQPQ